MSRGVNKAIIVGNLGQDPETKFMPNGNAVTNISVATSESWKDKETGQPVEKTEWHKIVFFNRLAEIAGEYLKKGSKVYIEGSLRTRKWQAQDGSDRYTTEIVANEMQMLDSRNEGYSGGQDMPMGSPQRSYAPAQSAAPQGGYQQPAQQPQQQYANPQTAGHKQPRQRPAPQGQQQGHPDQGFDQFDDDSIPF